MVTISVTLVEPEDYEEKTPRENPHFSQRPTDGHDSVI
jgi:hypothetical protein